jgi:hypothetical protein
LNNFNKRMKTIIVSSIIFSLNYFQGNRRNRQKHLTSAKKELNYEKKQSGVY